MTLTKKEINYKYYEKKRNEKIKKTLILEKDEIYKPIVGHEKYYITNKGRVYSTISCMFLLPSSMKIGYFHVCLSNRRRMTIHRLLGIHFIENPDNHPVIDHIDRNRHNNNIENLRWVTYSGNVKNSSHVINRKGCIFETKDKIGGKIYYGYRVVYYEDDMKRSKRFKTKELSEEFYKST